MEGLSWRIRLSAILVVAVLFGLIWLYTREYPVFTNTLEVSRLVLLSFLFGAGVAAAIVYVLRHRLKPWVNHVPEVLLIVFFVPLFMPLFASRVNRASGLVEHRPFEFVAETPYVASAYGWLCFQPVRITGYCLLVKDGQRLHRFQYKSQAYFPLSRPGDTVLLPIRQGCLGIEVMELR
ncbi:MAG: hypothetical protein NZM43_02295 [Saprospiraceae bacterium]|nr:hypothetical protein [Saprospiraceae bacterium]MDW8483131.1 hypothetical protein [Saprospiraceae bacterium]